MSQSKFPRSTHFKKLPDTPVEKPTTDASGTPLEELADTPVEEFPTAQIGKLPDTPIEELATAQIEKVTSTPIEELATAQIEKLPVTPVEELTMTQIEKQPVTPMEEPVATPIEELVTAQIEKLPVTPIEKRPVTPMAVPVEELVAPMSKLPDVVVEKSSSEPPPAFVTLYSPDSSLGQLLQELRDKRLRQTGFTGANFGRAWEGIWSNRTRSLLTLLGIVIGVAAVIGALTLGAGVGGYFQNIIASQGANTIFVSGSPANNRVTRLRQTHPSLTGRDLQVLGTLQHVTAISPIVSANGQVVYGNRNWRASGGINGVNADFQTIENWDMAQGLWFSSTQDIGAQPVAILGDTVVQNLFGGSNVDPINKQIRIRNQLFRVIGTLAPKGAPQQDDSVFIPYRAVQQRLTNSVYFGQIQIEVDDAQNADQVAQAITLGLETNHHISRGTPDDFQAQTSAQLLQQSNLQTQALSLFLTGIAAISLTVGGIGIMNIMLVSVTERTREIGLRISIGARRSDIRNQFLTEALFLCLMGGFVGMLIGIFVGWLTVKVIIGAIVSAGSTVNAPLVITPTTLILPFAVSALVGVVFGLYPALRASRLDPIVALRRAR